MRWAICAAVALALAGAALAQTSQPGPDEIEKLIADLGSDRWTVREEATRRLAAIGRAALPALRRAMLSDDLEVVTRAKMIIKGTTGLAPEKLQLLRESVQDAYVRGDYEKMISLSKDVTATKHANIIDWLWQARGCQLAEKWGQAVIAYENVILLIDKDMKEAANSAYAQPWTMLSHRHAISMRIASIQSLKLKDPKAAVKTLAKAAEFHDPNSTDVTSTSMGLLKELAAAQQAAGDLDAAFATWARLHKQVLKVRHARRANFLDIGRIARAVSTLPPDNLPQTPYLFVLTARNPAATLKPDEDETRLRCYCPSSNPDKPFWEYAFAPAPGKEFAAIEFTLDLEMLKPHWGGYFRCRVPTGGPHGGRKDLGTIRWPGPEEVGRKTCRRSIEIPPGIEVVYVTTGSSKGNFTLHSIEAKATLRPARKDAPPVLADSWVQTEALPAGGRFLCGDKDLRSEVAYRGFAPGQYRVSYELPGREAKGGFDFRVRPGEGWGIFINLDSPFRWTQAGPTDLGQMPPACTNLVRLPDKSYLALWCGYRRSIMLSRSKDLVSWSEPEPAPFNSLSDDVAPTACRTKDGTVWVGFLTKRMWLKDTGSGRFKLFITSTRDGKTWSRPRPTTLGGVGGTPPNPAQILQHPDGTCWVFSRHQAASGKSFDRLREFTQMDLQIDPTKITPTHQHVTIDKKGDFHL
ncbi:MAG TPA: hypothetical protein VNA25_24620, partial [Phycisphaerae bacterium]|nr:hypothetical protein [Phycisphaerae bacterium]